MLGFIQNSTPAFPFHLSSSACLLPAAPLTFWWYCNPPPPGGSKASALQTEARSSPDYFHTVALIKWTPNIRRTWSRMSERRKMGISAPSGERLRTLPTTVTDDLLPHKGVRRRGSSGFRVGGTRLPAAGRRDDSSWTVTSGTLLLPRVLQPWKCSKCNRGV